MPAFASEIKYIHAGKSMGSVDPRSVDPTQASAASVLCNCLPATTVPTLRSKTMPSLPAKSTRQGPCQDEKIFWSVVPSRWGQLTPVLSQYVRGQENIMLTRPVTMREHKRKTLIQNAELTMPLMEIDSRTIIYNHYNRLDTMYSPVYSKHRRTLRKWT